MHLIIANDLIIFEQFFNLRDKSSVQMLNLVSGQFRVSSVSWDITGIEGRGYLIHNRFSSGRQVLRQ